MWGEPAAGHTGRDDAVREGATGSGTAVRRARGPPRAANAASGSTGSGSTRTDGDYERHVAYCTMDPVKHGLVARVQDRPHSSFHRDVRRGLFPLDWGGEVEMKGEFGECG